MNRATSRDKFLAFSAHSWNGCEITFRRESGQTSKGEIQSSVCAYSAGTCRKSYAESHVSSLLGPNRDDRVPRGPTSSPEQGPRETTNSLGIRLVTIPAGEFDTR